MDWFLKRLRINSGRQVAIATLIVTTISVASPVGVFAVVLAIGQAPWSAYAIVLGICAAIPLLIAPPIAFFALSLLRLLTLTIERLDAHVRIDALTGVSTRASFLGQVRERLGKGGCFLMADADRFKSINDTYGHDVGDEALRRISEVLASEVPLDAIVGRLGGEEFGIFLPMATADRAAKVADRICDAVRHLRLAVGEHEVTLTVSIGCAVHNHANTLETTMKRADVALYRAKEAGRDNVQFAGPVDAGANTPAISRVH